MIYQRGKLKTWWYRFRFAGRIVHESARTASKTMATQAERNRRRGFEEKWNKIEKRTLPPPFEKASKEYLQSREHRVAGHTLSIDRQALKHLLPVFGSRLLCDIQDRDVAAYQAKRKREGAQVRTVNIETGALARILKMYKLEVNISTLPERRDVGRALAPEEEAKLLAATSMTDSACHTATVVALNTAMRSDEIRTLRWGQIDLAARTLTVGKSKTTAGTGRLIPLNVTAFDALVRWAGRYPDSRAEHFVFPACESRHVDPTRPTKGWRTAWRNALKQAGIKCRFHDLRVTCITKMAEGQASDMTIMAIAGHVSRRMLEHYSRIRMGAKRSALDALVVPIFEAGVHQNDNQLEEVERVEAAKLLN